MCRALISFLVVGVVASAACACQPADTVNELVRLRTELADASEQPLNRQRGERVAGWEEAGVDLLALLQRAPGGIDENFIVLRSPFGLSLVGYGTAPHLTVPSRWQELERAVGLPGWNGLREYYVRFPRPNLAVVTANPAWRIGRAVCSREIGASVLYSVGHDPLTAEDQEYRATFAAEARRARDGTICYSAHPWPTGGFVYRYFDEQGYSLPLLNSAAGSIVATIERRQPIDSYNFSPD